MKIDISKGIEILVFTGPESSGKTTSAKRISTEYQLPLVEEYARTYLNTFGPKYSYSDIQQIAAKQIENEVDKNNKNTLIICDTDIITLEIWALEKFGKSLYLIDELTDKKHYLLCYPDIPWEADPLRENPNDRLRLFHLYEEYLSTKNIPFTILNKKSRNGLYFEL